MIDNWRQPDNFSVKRHQEILDAVNPLTTRRATGELNLFSSPYGISINDTRRAAAIPLLAALKISTPFLDGRYGAKIGRWQAVINETTDNYADWFSFSESDNALAIVLDEVVNGGQGLSEDDVVFGELQPTTTKSGKPVYAISTGGASVPILRITAVSAPVDDYIWEYTVARVGIDLVDSETGLKAYNLIEIGNPTASAIYPIGVPTDQIIPGSCEILPLGVGAYVFGKGAKTATIGGEERAFDFWFQAENSIGRPE